MRVIVTRPLDQARLTARRLIAMGHEPIILPLTEIAPLDVDLSVLDTCDALVVTSRNAIASVASHTGLHTKQVLAVGAATAEELRRAGFTAVQSADGNAQGLAELVRESLPASARIGYPCGETRSPTLETTLRRAGYTIVAIEVYQALLVSYTTNTLNAAFALPRPTAAIIMSTANAERMAWLLRNHFPDQALDFLSFIAISAAAACPLKRAGFPNIVIAKHPTEADVLSALNQHQLKLDE
jgi:uroporphyrinogen-III synthase